MVAFPPGDGSDRGALSVRTGGVQPGPVFNGIGLSAVVAIVVGVRLHRSSDTTPWYLFAVGQALFVAGDVLAYNSERFAGRKG